MSNTHTFTSAAPSAGPFRDDQDLYDLLFEHFPPSRPDMRGTGLPLLIDDSTGYSLTFEGTKWRVDHLSMALYRDLGVRPDSIIAVYSPNSIDFPVMIWAAHRLGATVSCANPAYTPNELKYQLDAVKASVFVVHEDQLEPGFKAAEAAGIPKDKVVVIQSVESVRKSVAHNGGIRASRTDRRGFQTVEGLVERGKELLIANGSKLFRETRRKLKVGEGQSKLAFISFSSGTTGLPKGVAIQHYAPVSNVLQTFTFNQCSNLIGAKAPGRFRAGKDRSLGILPGYHIYGLVLGIQFMFYAGVCNVIIPKFKGIEAMLKSAVRHQISIWLLVPPQVVLLCKDPSAKKYYKDIKNLVHYIMIGAAPLSDDLSKQLMAILPGVDWSQAYGMTETATLTVQGPPGVDAVLGSAGRLVCDTEAKVISPTGEELGYDMPGELWVRSPSITLGYMNNRQATEEMFLSNGFMKTGDEVIINKAGDLFVVDRLKELIKVRGFQVAPAELEGFLLDHKDVSDAGVVGVEDEAAGERPLAYIALSQAAQEKVKKGGKKAEEQIKKSVMEFVKVHKIKYKHLVDVRLIEQIPKTPSGKILRRELREMAKKQKSGGKGPTSKL